jgi:hypothetical protein
MSEENIQEKEEIIYNSFEEFRNGTNEIYGEIIGKSIRGVVDFSDNIIQGNVHIGRFLYWDHNGNALKEPTRIVFRKWQADEDYGPFIQLEKDEANGIHHEEPESYVKLFEEEYKDLYEEAKQITLEQDQQIIEALDKLDLDSDNCDCDCDCKKKR